MEAESDPGAAPRRDLDQDLGLVPTGDGRFTATAPDHWLGWRGLAGCYVTALMLNAALQAAPDDAQRPASLTLHFLRVMNDGPVELSVERVRTGRRVSSCLVRAVQDGAPVGIALAAFAVAVPSDEPFDHTTQPDAAPPETIEPARVDQPGWPAYLSNLDLRLAVGHPPFSRAEEALSGGWMRMVEPRRPDPLAVAVSADAWAPAAFARLEAPVPTPTVDLTLHFRDHAWYERARADDFVLTASRVTLFKDGQFTQDSTVWSPDGVLLAEVRQLLVMAP